MFYNMFGHTDHMHPVVCTRLMPIRHVVMILSWGKASDRIENTSPLFIGLSFLFADGQYCPFDLCYRVRHP
jgi:hypothetical protein